MILFANIVCNTYFECLLGSVLTANPQKRDINTVQDLIHSNHIIVGPLEIEEFITDRHLRDRFFEGKIGICQSNMMHDHDIACVHLCRVMQLYVARKPGIHVAQEYIRTLPVNFVVRENWPLKPLGNIQNYGGWARSSVCGSRGREFEGEVRRLVERAICRSVDGESIEVGILRDSNWKFACFYCTHL